MFDRFNHKDACFFSIYQPSAPELEWVLRNTVRRNPWALAQPKTNKTVIMKTWLSSPYISPRIFLPQKKCMHLKHFQQLLRTRQSLLHEAQTLWYVVNMAEPSMEILSGNKEEPYQDIPTVCWPVDESGGNCVKQNKSEGEGKILNGLTCLWNIEKVKGPEVLSSVTNPGPRITKLITKRTRIGVEWRSN